MNQEFNGLRKVYPDRDENGVVPQLLRTHALVAIQAGTPSSPPLTTCIDSANCWV